jgi:hypothetical protein
VDVVSELNLELSCGASFDKLGYTWNDDEAYGFEGAHVSLRNSWRSVVDALAEPLTIVYDCPVTAIEIVEEGQPAVPQPTTVQEQPKQQPQVIQHSTSPSRKSRRLPRRGCQHSTIETRTKQTQSSYRQFTLKPQLR